MATQLNQVNFEEILASDKPVIIDFWAEWCGPCRRIAPIIDELSVEFDGKAVICKCDVDSNDEIAAKYGIRNIPTILFLKNGELVDKTVGAATKAQIQEKLEAIL